MPGRTLKTLSLQQSPQKKTISKTSLSLRAPIHKPSLQRSQPSCSVPAAQPIKARRACSWGGRGKSKPRPHPGGASHPSRPHIPLQPKPLQPSQCALIRPLPSSHLHHALHLYIYTHTKPPVQPPVMVGRMQPPLTYTCAQGSGSA